MTSYGSDIFAKTLNATDIRSTGVIHWKDFDPKIENAGISTLAAVLEAGNDAHDSDIVGVGKIVMGSGGGDVSILAASSITGVSNLACNDITTTDGRALEFTVLDELSIGESAASSGSIVFSGTQDANSITGASITNRVVVTNADLSSVTNKFGDQTKGTLAETLVLGNSAGSSDINMNSQQVTNVASIGTLEAVIGTRISYSDGDGTRLQGSAKVDNPTVVSNMDFATGTGNTFPTSVDTLSSVCTRGNTMPEKKKGAAPLSKSRFRLWRIRDLLLK